MRTLYLLDTTTLTHLKNGHPRVVANHAIHCVPSSGDIVGVASINVEEVIGGGWPISNGHAPPTTKSMAHKT